MSETIYEAMLKGKTPEEIASQFEIDLKTIREIASSKLDYDCLSQNEKEKALHTLSLLSKQGWRIYESCPLEQKIKLIDLIRRIQHDRSEIQGLTKEHVEVDGSIEIKWKDETP